MLFFKSKVVTSHWHAGSQKLQQVYIQIFTLDDVPVWSAVWEFSYFITNNISFQLKIVIIMKGKLTSMYQDFKIALYISVSRLQTHLFSKKFYNLHWQRYSLLVLATSLFLLQFPMMNAATMRVPVRRSVTLRRHQILLNTWKILSMSHRMLILPASFMQYSLSGQ